MEASAPPPPRVLPLYLDPLDDLGPLTVGPPVLLKQVGCIVIMYGLTAPLGKFKSK